MATSVSILPSLTAALPCCRSYLSSGQWNSLSDKLQHRGIALSVRNLGLRRWRWEVCRRNEMPFRGDGATAEAMLNLIP